jgi:hypothetical protein
VGNPPAEAGALYRYLQDTQRLLNDEKEEKFNRYDLTRFINSGRRKVAAESQCIRFLLPSSGSFASVSVNSCGEGYTSPPTVVSAGPSAWGVGFQTADIQVGINSLGQVCSAKIVNPGSGYIAPDLTLEGGGGTGASLKWTLTPFLSTLANKEVYYFQDYNPLLPPGIKEILAIQNVSVSWGGIKPTMRHLDWSAFQAYLRSYNTQATNWPAVWAQYAQGVQGSVYLNPIPSMTLQMEWDTYCLPEDLTSDDDPEFIPYPFTNAVPYYAAWWATIPGNTDMANYFDALYKRSIKEARSYTDIVVFPDFYTPDIA